MASNDRGAGRHRRDLTGDGPWLERFVMSTPVGDWSTLRLVLSLAWIGLMSGLSASFAYDDLVLNQRGEIVQAVATRTKDDQRDRTFDAELQVPFQGLHVLVEGSGRRPGVGDVVDLEVDPLKPSRVRNPHSTDWNPWDVAFVALVPVGVVIAWARWNHWLRVSRRPRHR